MIMQINIPKDLIDLSVEPDEIINAWLWMVIQKTIQEPEWHVAQRLDGRSVHEKGKIWFRRCTVTIEEGLPKGRSFLASDHIPYLVRMFCQCQVCEPTILERV